MPPQKTQTAPDFIPAEAPDFIPAGGQGSAPVTTPGTTTVNPTLGNLVSTTGRALGKFGVDALQGLGASAIGGLTGSDQWAREHLPAFFTNQGMGFGPPANLENVRQLSTPEGRVQTAFKTAGDVAQFAIPGGVEEKAATRLATLVPRLGGAAAPLARATTSGAGAGLVNAAQGGGFLPGAAIGPVSELGARGLQTLAAPFAESALRITPNQKFWQPGIGRGILEDTRGFTPAAVEESGQATVDHLMNTLRAQDAAAAAEGRRGSLQPARDAMASRQAGYKANRAVQTASDIQPIIDFLATDQSTGLPLGPLQTPAGIRAMKRGLSADYIGRWTPDVQPATQKAAAREAYGTLNRELHSVVPESALTDERVDRLLPVLRQANKVDASADLPRRIVERVGRPTGGLAPMIAGAYGAGPVGALAGLVGPELTASPSAKLIAARSLNAAPRLAPIVSGATNRFVDYLRNQQ